MEFPQITGRPSIRPNKSPTPTRDSYDYEDDSEQQSYNQSTDESVMNSTGSTTAQNTPKFKSPRAGGLQQNNSLDLKLNTSTDLRHRNNQERRQNYEGSNPKCVPESYSHTTTKGTCSGLKLILGLVFSLCIFLCIYFSFNPVVFGGEVECSFDSLQKKYPQQDASLWDNLTIGIQNILHKNVHTSGVYLFIHKASANADKLVEQIANQASNCFGKSMKPAKIKEEFLTDRAINDYGWIIENYKRELQKNHVVFIPDIQDIPAESARALHTICDTYSPIKKDSVHLLTLEVSNTNDNIRSTVQDTLSQLWGALQDNELEPLITRVTDSILVLKD